MAPTAVGSATDCPQDGTIVGTAEELHRALAAAVPGSVIRLSGGVRYDGPFVATVSGTAELSIGLCGPASAVLDGGGVRGGYGMHLHGASHWRLSGFSVTNAQKGVMLDGSNHTVIDGLTVTVIGEEAIHLRTGSSDNTVRNCTISDTGLRRETFGEGVYIGSAVSNWHLTGGQPDRSDRNLVEHNTISNTTAEAVDIKEGTTGREGHQQHLRGLGAHRCGLVGRRQGNDWLIEGNIGTSSPLDGFQTHEILSGWGRGNVFRANTATGIAAAGVGFGLRPPLDNKASC